MGFLTPITDLFRKETGAESQALSSNDRYTTLSMIMAISSHTVLARDYLKLVLEHNKLNRIILSKDHNRPPSAHDATMAYDRYCKALGHVLKDKEYKQTGVSLLEGLDAVLFNLETVENNFTKLLDVESKSASEIHLSALLVSGYVSKAEQFATWVGYLLAHVIPTEGSHIAPFWTRSMLDQAETMAQFVTTNLVQWDPKHGGILQAINRLKAKGLDIPLQNNGTWVDEILHDDQFSDSEQVTMTAALRSGSMMASTIYISRQHKVIELASQRKDWLLAKIGFEEAKLQDMDHNSPEYKRLSKAVDYYADTITKLEQKIERARS